MSAIPSAASPSPPAQPVPGAEPDRAQPPGFGVFQGVFRPVALTILGAMLYLREGWLVGDTGLLGALMVIGLATAITGSTALSLSSIASNVRVRPGGAFAIISQALGLEAGGAIGIPLFIAQAASSAMYIYAFAEAWVYIFPTHPPQIVAAVGFAFVSLLAWRSAGLAFKAQAVMLFVVAAALMSALLGLFTAPELHVPTLVGDFDQASFVNAFSIFFPAATGIMVGVGMSGSLADPRRAIPKGTLAAWGVTLGIYALFAFWYAVIATPEELLANKTVMIDRALFGPLVLAGLLTSTLMAALSSLVAAPRLLQAMAASGVVPGSAWLSRMSDGDNPRNAVVATTGLGALGLAAGSLDAIAPIITSFFIMTYLAINLVVYVEQVLGMISFRPTFRIPRATPLVGISLCLVGLALGSPFGGVAELLMVVGIYAALSRRQLETPWETVRSGIAVSLAQWAARRAAGIQRSERAWKPDLMVPVASVQQVSDMLPLVESLCARSGSAKFVALGNRTDLVPALPGVVDELLSESIHGSWTKLQTDQYMAGIGLALDAMQAALFPPNLVLVDASRVDDDEIAEYLVHCRRLSVGMALWFHHPDGKLGQQQGINVWLSDRSPEWKLQLHLVNLDLPVLLGFLLSQDWKTPLRLLTVVADPEQVAPGRRFLLDLADQARLPEQTEVQVASGPFLEKLASAPHADLSLFGLPNKVEKARLERIRDASGGSCLFLLDSGNESALA